LFPIRPPSGVELQASTREVKIMNHRIRKWLVAAITAITTGILVWLPTVAQAGITASGVD
jgi:hypothetical protein